jgi:fructose-1-phosphate kinase PfkB-like protein
VAAVTSPSIAIFAPNLLLTVTLELEGAERQSIHFHAGGQGFWAGHMAHTMGASPVLCGYVGGESGNLLRPLLDRVVAPEHMHLVATASTGSCYVVDRRSGKQELVAMRLSDPPSRDEFDELFSITCAQALGAGWLIVTNALPVDGAPIKAYGDLVADARAGGCRTLVDLSAPRLDSALAGEPDLVKINDWELAEYVSGPVSTPELLLAGAQRLRERGARRVVVTRGSMPALVLDGDQALQLSAPCFEHGFREGCGDSMMGALAATWAAGESFHRALVVGAAAGAANFLRRGLGQASREVVDELADAVTLQVWPAAAAA